MTHESTAAGNTTQAVPTTAEQRVSFERDGYLIISGALRSDEAADAGYAVDRREAKPSVGRDAVERVGDT